MTFLDGVPVVRLFRRSLAARVTILLACLLSILLSAASFILIRLWERSVIDAATSETERFADTIKRSAQFSMLGAHAEEVREIINAVGHQKGVQWVRVFNKEGRVIHSTNASETGSVLDKNAEACYRCHETGQPLERLPSSDRSRIVKASDGHRVLATIDPIFNAEACSSAPCHAHAASQPVLGVLDVAVSLEPTDRMIRSRGRGIKALGAAAVVSVSGLAALLLQVYVGQPVRRLVDATRLVADGQLDHVIEVDGQDEIARLAASFNRMTLSLQKTSREVSELNASLEARVLVKTTELHAAQLQVARAERLAAIGRMAAGIAHEINNPLTGVLTFSHLLLRAAPEGSRQRADLETIIRETNRCAGIIRDLLKFSRETPAKKGPCDVNTIARQALQLVQHQSELHNVRVVWQLAETVPRIVADASQIEQVFLNIIVNAVQAMPGGGDLTITSGLREGTSKGQGPAVYVTIADTGCGISPENVGKVFDPFFTTKDPGQGTGLGLSVSHELVESQGGSIEVDSVVGSGTQFTVVLPVDGASPPLGVAQ